MSSWEKNELSLNNAINELDFENILAPKFDMMYLDIEVYSPDGFPPSRQH